MSSFFGINSNYNFFGTSNTNSSSNNFLGDYSLIRSGAYKKLMNAYYGKQKSSSNSTSSTEDSEETKQEKLNLKTVKTAAEGLQSSASKLRYSKALQGKKNEETGKVEYDMEAIKKDVDSFIKDYNSTIKAAGESDTNSVLRKTVWMINDVKSNSKLLGQAGITIGEDNTLSVDAEKFKKADISTLKSLFTGYGSMMDRVMNKASELNRLSSASLNTASKNAVSYSSKGDYATLNTSSIYDSFF